MKDIKKIINLDYISIKPYFTLKNLIILLFLYFFYFFISKNPMAATSVILFFSIIYSSYPFLIGEEAGIDSLYRIFGIKSEKVVRGRYIFGIILFLISLIISILLSTILFFFIESFEIKEFLATSLSYFAVYLLFLSFRYPLYFKYGYKKAKSISAITFAFIAVISFFVMAFKDSLYNLLLFVENNIFISLLFVIVIILAIVIISVKISEKFYKNRDF
ncbi:ABC-2 transporter permease [Peptoniphilus timonensis]|uniref:ABC-2 transporter permease n=1 Tax=Peptoniphilus timonensis TaxID=1268254 RepID=UPI00031FC2E0|nr:ABC-2 transporter permease [Peptoniphilus timonensis]